VTLTLAVTCFPGSGGSGVIASELAVGLARRGHRVHVLSSAALSRPMPACDRLTFHPVSAPAYPPLEGGYALALASSLIELGRRERIDVVHSHYALPHAVSAWLAASALGTRAPRRVVTLHGTDVSRFGREPAYRTVLRESVLASDAISVPSQHLECEARAVLDLPADRRVAVVPNFVDTEHFVPPTQRDVSLLRALLQDHCDTQEPWGPVLVHASNFRAVKRPLDLIEVLVRVRKALPARLVLIGDGPELERVRVHARALGVDRHVAILGHRADFLAYLQHADVFLSSSETESFGLAALEALSCGLPVCGYRVGGLVEVVGDHAGRLVAPHDVDALAAAVLSAVPNAERTRLGAAGRARALSLFKLDPALDRYEALYREIA
jgi:L-malate glycosyltransferase